MLDRFQKDEIEKNMIFSRYGIVVRKELYIPVSASITAFDYIEGFAVPSKQSPEINVTYRNISSILYSNFSGSHGTRIEYMISLISTKECTKFDGREKEE